MDYMRSKDEWGHHLGKMLPYRGSSPLTAQRIDSSAEPTRTRVAEGPPPNERTRRRGNPTVFSAGSPSFATRPYLACARSE